MIELDELLVTDLKEVMKNLYNEYGRETQYLIVGEECSELNKAVLKSIRYHKVTYAGVYVTNQIIEELAHVLISALGLYEDMSNNQRQKVIDEIAFKTREMHKLIGV